MPSILKDLKIFGGLDFGTDGNSALPLELALVDTVLTPEARAIEAPKAEPKAASNAIPPRATTERPTVRPNGAASVTSGQQAPTWGATKPPVAKPAPATAPAASTQPAPAAKPPVANIEPPVTVPKPMVSEPVKEPVTETVKPAASVPQQPATELDRLRMNWRDVMAQAPPDTLRSTAIAVLRSAGVKVTSVDGDTVVITFNKQIFVDRICAPENIRVTEKIIGNYLGRPVHVRCTLEQTPNHLIEEAQRLGARITEEK